VNTEQKAAFNPNSYIIQLKSKGGRAAQASGKAHKFNSETASQAGKADALIWRRMLLTVTCSMCEQKLTALEIKHHVC
jgi:hypothetical protein